MSKYDRHEHILSPNPIEKELLSVFKANGDLVILDIGSCEGEDSIRYSRLFPNATIFAFEPLEDNAKLIEQNIEKYGVKNVTLVRSALGKSVGEASFYVSSGTPPGKENIDDWDFGNKSSSLFQPDQALIETPWLKFEQCISVPVNTLEVFCKDESLELIDFVHMDVQGAELDVLRGAGDLLHKISLIWMEVEAVSLYKDQPLKSEVEAFMAANGFRLVKDTVNSKAGDQLYINDKMNPADLLKPSLWNRVVAKFS